MSIDRQALIDKYMDMSISFWRSMRTESMSGLSNFELTLPQFRTLALLDAAPLRMSDLAENLGISYSSATSMIDRLVGKGLVSREQSPSDRRVVLCRLTPIGKQEMEQFWSFGREQFEQITEVIGEDDLRLLADAMEVFNKAAEALHERAVRETV